MRWVFVFLAKSKLFRKTTMENCLHPESHDQQPDVATGANNEEDDNRKSLKDHHHVFLMT